MKRIVIAVVSIAVFLVGYWLLSPLFTERRVSEGIEDIVPPPTPAASPTAPLPSGQSGPETVGRGAFVGLEGHNAQGTATLFKIGEKYYIRFEDDFRVTNGPDLFVYLGKNNRYDRNTQLAALKGNVGAQNYEIPTALNVSEYNEVWVWCRAFSVAFGKAEWR